MAPELYEKLLQAPKQNVLIGLQLKEDSNIIEHSSYDSMEEFLLEILPPLVEKGYTCFIKPHPLGYNDPLNAQDHKICREFCETFETVTWIEEGMVRNSQALLEKVSAVLSVNSSIGFEAMVLGKTIVGFGKSAYNISNMLPSFEDFIEGNLGPESIRMNNEKIVNYLLFSYLVPRDKVFNYASFCSFIQRSVMLSELKDLSQIKSFSELYPTFRLKEAISYNQRKQQQMKKRQEALETRKRAQQSLGGVPKEVPAQDNFPIEPVQRRKISFLKKIIRELFLFSPQRCLPRPWRPRGWKNSTRNNLTG